MKIKKSKDVYKNNKSEDYTDFDEILTQNNAINYNAINNFPFGYPTHHSHHTHQDQHSHQDQHTHQDQYTHQDQHTHQDDLHHTDFF